MAEARPVYTTFLLSVAGVGLLFMWWIIQGPAGRLHRLRTIAVQEQATTLPPQDLIEQAEWLARHRFNTAQREALLVGTLALMALMEGQLARQRDVYAEVRVKLWALGVVGGTGILGMLAWLCWAPWPLRPWQVAIVVAGLPALALYCLTRGRPYVP